MVYIAFPIGSCRAHHVLACALFLLSSILLFIVSVHANGARSDLVSQVRFEQKLNEQVPLDLAFRDESGKSVELGTYFGEKSAILVLVYYQCPNLCPFVVESLARSLRAISFDAGKEFNVLVVSIDPTEGPELAAAEKRKYLERYGRVGAERGWHFLTGEKASIDRLTGAVGFHYAYDAQNKKDLYVHPTGIVVLTPTGRVSRYLYGIDYSPRDLRLGLVEASSGKIGSPVDQLLLFCYQYDATTGKYTVAIMNILRLAGVSTAVGLGAFVLIMVRRERLARKAY